MINLVLFLASFSLFFFELLSIQGTALVLGSSYNYAVIGLAIVGQTAGAAVVSVLEILQPAFWCRTRHHRHFVTALVILIAVTIAGYFSVLTFSNLLLSTSADAFVMPKRGLMILTLAANLPNFWFGVLVSWLFESMPARRYPKLYFFDLCGGAVGAALSFFIIEHTKFTWAIVVPVAACMLAALSYSFASRSRKRVSISAALIFLSILAFVLQFPHAFEPQLDLRVLGEKGPFTFREVSHKWTSYAHLSTVEKTGVSRGHNAWVVLGRGEGAAELQAYYPENPPPEQNITSALCLGLGVPQDVLVLFAGAGDDMVDLNAVTNGQVRITGVEMNPFIFREGLRYPELKLNEFFARGNINMKIEEARVFLESEKHRYDVILTSWSGATFAYYSGAITQTTKYIYTYGGVRAMLERLKPGGYAIYLNMNKLRLLYAVKKLVAEKGLDPARSVVLFYDPRSTADSFDPWDEYLLLVKPDGFSDAQVAQIGRQMEPFGYRFAYRPGQSARARFPYAHFLKTRHTEKYLRYLKRVSGADFRSAGDDNPFVFQLYRADSYFSAKFLKNIFLPPKKGRDYRERYAFYILLVFFASVAWIVLPLYFLRGKHHEAAGLPYLIYFSTVGAAFMFVEIALMQRLTLLVGSPGLTFALSLASLIFFAGLGAFYCDRLAKRPQLIIAAWSFLVVYLVLLAVWMGPWMRALLPAGMGWRLFFAVVLIIPAALPMGLPFTLGLERAKACDRVLVPWAWAINGAVGSFAAALSPLIASAYGFLVLTCLAALFYLIALGLYTKGLPGANSAG